MSVRKRKVDSNTRNAVAYMQDAASNRGIKKASVELFAYAITRACSEYIEQYVLSKNLSEVATEIGKLIPEGTGQSIPVDEIEYDQRIGGYISAVESMELHGPISILLDIASNNSGIASILESNSITMDDLKKSSKFEQARVNTPDKKRRRRPTRPDIDIIDDLTSRMPMPVKKKSSATQLSSFCTDLTELARSGEIGHVFCRDGEIVKVVTSLLRKVKCNPLLIGEPGVGKTAIVEGLAAKIVSGDVPDRLKTSTVMSLDVSSVVGGTTLRGEFEDRMHAIMDELVSRKDVILFIDELHMIVGAGDHSQTMDAGNILKPYLARGDIKCIGATTYYDYNKHMKKDGALVRRFQRITVSELGKDQTLDIMRGLKPTFEEFHDIKIEDEALKTIVNLSSKHISDRYFPDKAIDCLDEACARAVILDQDVCPSLIEESMSDLASVPLEIIRQTGKDRMKRTLEKMKSSILGNDKAIAEMVNMMTSRTSAVSSGERPLCTMIVKGPKGVGKKSSVRVASMAMFGTNDSIIEVDGADFTESHSVSKIVGSPPGYVGYSEESELFRGIRRRPHSIIMITGFEIMHPSIREQIMKMVKTGFLKDGEGNLADFRSGTVVFVSDTTVESSMGFGSSSSESDLNRAIWASVIEESDSIISFGSVSDHGTLRSIAILELERMRETCSSAGVRMSFSDTDLNNSLSGLMECTPSEIRRKIRKKIEMSLSDGDFGVEASS